MGPEHRYVRRLERSVQRSLLPIAILAALSAGPTYGYALIDQLRRKGIDDASLAPSAIYPCLAGLRAARLVVAYHGTESLGPIRKYYELTRAGRELLPELIALPRRLGGGIGETTGPPVAGHPLSGAALGA